MKWKLSWLFVWISLSLFITGCSTPQTSSSISNVPTSAGSETNEWPTQDWQTSSPEAQGMDSRKLSEMLAIIQEKNLDFDSLLVIRHGTIVSETYFDSYDRDTLHQLFSCTKSFIATLVGIAIDRGLIEDIDQPVLSFYKDAAIENMDPGKESMKLDDLLTMRSGLGWVEGNPAYREMSQSADWAAYVLDKPMVEAPGTRFNYCSGCSHELSSILQRATGMNTVDFAEQTLFTPMGITRYKWEKDTRGLSNGGWGLLLTPREMAKLGYLYLHAGEWDGQQLVSTDWVRLATQRHTDATDGLGYGYQWWTYPLYDAYTALGLYGQTIFVIPGQDLIVVTTAGSLENHSQIFHLIDDYIFPAILDSEEENRQ